MGPAFSRKHAVILSIALVTVLTAVSFLSSLDNEFITTWDDRIYVTENPVIKTFSWQGVRAAFSSFHINFYHPLVIVSYAMEHALFGLNPAAYHMTNLALHVLNSLLVFWMIFLLSDCVSVSLVASLLFAVHPLHVESVAWISERKDVLSTFFFLLALILYLRFRKFDRRAFYYLSIAVFLLALLSKPMVVTLPLVLLLCDYLCSGKISGKTLLEKMPFFILSIIFGIVHLFAHFGPGTSDHDVSKIPFEPVKNLLLACWGIVFYLFKTVLPVSLSALYPYPESIAMSSSRYFLPPVFVLLLAVLIFFTRKYSREIIFGCLFFAVTILPVLRLLPFHGDIVAADRYMYIPSIGLFYLAGTGVYWAYHRRGSFAPGFRVLTVILSCAVILTFSILSYQRNNVWQDDESLWKDTAEKSPGSHRAHNNLGFVYSKQGRFEEAVDAYRTALEINPYYLNARTNLGLTYGALRRWDEAIAAYEKALEINPRDDAIYNLLGIAYAEKGLLSRAMGAFQKALEINPRSVKAQNNLGNIYLAQRRYEAAVQAYEAALRIDPAFQPAQENLKRAMHFSRQTVP